MQKTIPCGCALFRPQQVAENGIFQALFHPKIAQILPSFPFLDNCLISFVKRAFFDILSLFFDRFRQFPLSDFMRIDSAKIFSSNRRFVILVLFAYFDKFCKKHSI